MQFFKLNVEINPEFLWFCFTSLCDWFRKFAPLSRPIRFKNKANHALVTPVLLRFWQFACIHFGFSRLLCSDWPWWLLSLRFTTLNRKMSLKFYQLIIFTHQSVVCLCYSLFTYFSNSPYWKVICLLTVYLPVYFYLPTKCNNTRFK